MTSRPVPNWDNYRAVARPQLRSTTQTSLSKTQQTPAITLEGNMFTTLRYVKDGALVAEREGHVLAHLACKACRSRKVSSIAEGVNSSHIAPLRRKRI